MGIAFTKGNFPKGTKFWHDSASSNQCEVISHWNELNQVKVLKSNGMVSIYIESHMPVYHLMKKDKTMTLNHEEIKKAIEALPGVCKEGKEGVAKILKEFGYVAPVEKVVIEPGCIYVRKEELAEKGRALAMFYILPNTKGENMNYICFHWRGVDGVSSVSYLKSETLVLYAKSIKEAFTRLKDEGRKVSDG